MTKVNHGFPTCYIIGPPGAGKSTLGRLVASELGLSFQTIDDWVPRVYPPEMHGKPMTDEQVDAALSLLLRNSSSQNQLVEFAYHDYLGLIRSESLRAFGRSKKIVIWAPLYLCHERNRLRGSHVPIAYVERVWHSTQLIIDCAETGSVMDVLVVDTSVKSVVAATADIGAYVRIREGSHERS